MWRNPTPVTVLGPMSGLIPVEELVVRVLTGVGNPLYYPVVSFFFEYYYMILICNSPHVSESDPHAPPVLCGYERELGSEYVWVVGLWMDLVRFKLKDVSWCIKCNCRHIHLMQSFFCPWLFPLHDGSLRIPPFSLRHVSPWQTGGCLARSRRYAVVFSVMSLYYFFASFGFPLVVYLVFN